MARTVISLSEKLIDEQFYLLLKDTSIMIRQNAAEQLKKDILNTISPQTIKLNNNKNKIEKISGIY